MPPGESMPPDFLRLMAERFAILGDPTRLAIVHCLMRHGEPNVTHIVGATGQTLPNVSKHLRLLREAGVVGRRRKGQQVFYRITDPTVEQLCRLVCESLLNDFKEQTGRDTTC